MTRQNTERLILSLSAGKARDGRPLSFRLVERKERGVLSFVVVPFVHDDGTAYVTEMRRPVDPRTFGTRDEALADIAARLPGHTATARAFAFLPHSLSRDGMTATVKGTRAFYCDAAARWIGSDLRTLAGDL